MRKVFSIVIILIAAIVGISLLTAGKSNSKYPLGQPVKSEVLTEWERSKDYWLKFDNPFTFWVNEGIEIFLNFVESGNFTSGTSSGSGGSGGGGAF